MNKRVEMSVRISHYLGEDPDFFDLYFELRDVLEKHFGGAFFKRKGVTYHITPIMEGLPPEKKEVAPVRARRVRTG